MGSSADRSLSRSHERSHEVSLEISREFDADDRVRVLELIEAATAAAGRRPLSDHLYLDLVNGGAPGFAGFLLADHAGQSHRHGQGHGAGHRSVAYGQLSSAHEGRLFEFFVQPGREADLADIGAELLDAAFDVIATDGGGRIVWWVSSPSRAHVQLAADAGLREYRRLHQMRRALPADRAVTIDTRAFRPRVAGGVEPGVAVDADAAARPSDDETAWLRVNNRAFADHGEQGGWTLEMLRAREAEDWFDADGFRIHERDGRMAGFCWTKIHPGDEHHAALGEIYVIAVDPDFHGLGLGSQLTLAGLDWLASRGITTAMLYVDADNTTAVAMYERLGFHVHLTNVAFAADIAARAGTETAVPECATPDSPHHRQEPT